MSADTYPDLTLPVFRDGEVLRADGLTRLQDVQRDARWLHNRTLHSSGVAVGLELGGTPGAAEVTVTDGTAIDSHGRELVVTATKRLDLTDQTQDSDAGATTYLVLVRYAEGGDGSHQDVLATGLVTVADAASGITGDAVALGEITVKGRRLVDPPTEQLRRSAVAQSRPYIQAGATDPSTTDWTPWVAGGAVGGPPASLGVQASVDTTSAAFATTPHYLAHVIGSRIEGVSKDGRDVLVWDGVARISRPTRDGFVLQLFMPERAVGSCRLNPRGGSPERAVQAARHLAWSVAWMGVES